ISVMEEFQKQLRTLRPMLPTYLHLLGSALLPIYAGAHASLTRPSSAAKPPKSKKETSSNNAEDDDSEDDSISKIEGLSASDAIWFPLLAGCTLGGLYLIIKWLEDPSILNKILNWYLALFGVFGVARLFGDILNVVSSYIFPSRYFHDSQIWECNRAKTLAVSQSDALQSRTSPFPGTLSKISLPASLNRFLWTLRTSYPTLCFRLSFRPSSKTHLHITPSSILSLLTALIVVLYYNLVSRPWYLTNILGFAFAYNALQLISPTTSSTGTLVLASLFLYDIYFVFYTPLMVTVATSLDIPAKLLFPRPPGPDGDPAKQHLSMLGLGDVVLPGMMIGFALRLDLYMHYLKQQKSVSIVRSDAESVVDHDTDIKSPTAEASEVDTDGKEDSASKTPTTEDIQSSPASYASDSSTPTALIVKATYIPIAPGQWGLSFWLPRSDLSLRGSQFPKPYFHASLIGYIVGMLLTLGIMQITGHAQPALFYLVPCVLVSFWGTAVVRGETRQVWAFDESEEQKAEEEKKKQKEVQEVVKEGKDRNGTEAQARKAKSRSRTRWRNGATTKDVISLNLRVGITSSKSTKECSRDEQVDRDSQQKRVDSLLAAKPKGLKSNLSFPSIECNAVLTVIGGLKIVNPLRTPNKSSRLASPQYSGHKTPTPLTMAIPPSSPDTTAPTPLTFPPSAFAKLAPRSYLHAHLSSPAARRPSGRLPSESRKSSINTGSLTHCHGSAVVRTGDTAVVCGIRGEILNAEDVLDYKPATTVDDLLERYGGRGIHLHEVTDEGMKRRSRGADAEEMAYLNLLVPNVELSTGCSPAYLPGGPPSEEAQSLSHRILSLLHTTQLLSMDDLRIWYHPLSLDTPTASDANVPTATTEEELSQQQQPT
ncbi:MAG: hypothetical protein LQ338_008210, partial [Usnochroma carphineum]